MLACGVEHKWGDVADSVSRAADTVKHAADASAKVRPAMRAWGAWSFASLLSRMFGR